jgi:steroid delta-isomerase-like uncharacterized protein
MNATMNATMSSEDVKKLNMYFYDEVFRRKNVDAVDDLLSDDFVEHIPAPGQKTDRNGAKSFIAHMLQAFPDLDFEIENQIVDGESIAVVGSMTGTHSGEFLGVPASGRKVNVMVMDTALISDGKITDHWGLIDVPTLMTQVGMAPPTK